MNKIPHKLKRNDKVAIVCLSRGLLGEDFIEHELEIGLRRLKEYGLKPVIMENALKGIDFLDSHPECRAQDLKDAFLDDTIKAIICAIGGNDTYRLYPYLLEDEELVKAVQEHPKIFTGFSDTTMNHLMFSRLGMVTFYGPNFLVDLAELAKDMLPYTKASFEKFFGPGEPFEIQSSPVWYKDRESYDQTQIGVGRIECREEHGRETLNGGGVVKGRLYGGGIESIYDGLTGFDTSEEEPALCEKYNIFPSIEEWGEKILFLETSESASAPGHLKEMLLELKGRNILQTVRGVLVGKPIDEKYYEEYRDIYHEVFADMDTPVLYNLNFGHALPRCILPYGIMAEIDFDQQTVKIIEKYLMD